jgi:GT2 family glycosyltransferase
VTGAVDISFVILSWNSARYLEMCIEGVRSALAGGPLSFELLILDNGSQDGSRDLLARFAAADPARIHAFYESANTGTTRSRNRLLGAARGGYVCVMDSDVELAPGVVETLIGFLARDPSLGIVVPRILLPSGRRQKSVDRFPTVVDKVNRFFRLRAIEAREERESGGSLEPRYVDYGISAFWLMRREVLQQVGLLDERIFYAPEDVDYCLRVWQRGLRILYVPAVAVVHHTQEISRGFRLNRAKFHHLKGLAYYFTKHRYVFRRPRFGSGTSPVVESAR